ncbi:DnaJ-domain-containing protein [Serendipita vermifera]|nr:DnaJ-domain-containing protein [Serendipita vermifera]
MAQYNYDGGLAAYFLLTFLALLLIPFTISVVANLKSSPPIEGCQCQECIANGDEIRRTEGSTFLKSGLNAKTLLISLGWMIFSALLYFVLTSTSINVVYDPFTILGISPSATEKEIKKFYKKLSLKFHPDTVKIAEGQTPEQAQAHFIELTKAYKALTDEVVRKNFLEYGHPDGKQSVEVGLALPAWVVDAHNNIWVLGMYGIVIGGILPYIVGKWWFGSRSRTKDGVQANTASIFFKDVAEESTPTSLIASLSKGCETERSQLVKSLQANKELESLRQKVEESLGASASGIFGSLKSKGSQHSFLLLYAHLLRLSLSNPTLKAAQKELLLQLPVLLNSLLAMSLGHGWLPTSIEIMHLHAYFSQAIEPGKSSLLQFPTITEESVKDIKDDDVTHLLKMLQEDRDRTKSLLSAASHVGRLDVVDAQFKVIGERLITPNAFVQLVFKVRLVAPLSEDPLDVNDLDSAALAAEEEADAAFLLSKGDTEDMPSYQPQWAHAPHWPVNRKPGWWCLVGDSKSQKVFVPPFKFSDVPWSNVQERASRNYRTYKMQFQAPPQVGTYTLHVTFVSDTWVGEDQTVYLQLKVDDLSALDEDEQGVEDEISDPEEDTLAGQMAAMRGGKVKKSPYHGADSDEESTTDGDEDSDSDSDSDSD